MALFGKSPTNYTPTRGMNQKIEDMVSTFGRQRLSFERRWYNNNFFDDGYHFRYLSRKTGKVVDLSEYSRLSTPRRAIPKASRQIRGVVNLLMALDPVPVIYPEKVGSSAFVQRNPMTGQATINTKAYEQARRLASEIAKKKGNWVEKEWEKQDLKFKLTHMALLTAKHGVSYLQIYPDPIKERIVTSVYDAFDIYLDGSCYSIYDSPSIIKTRPMTIASIKANEEFEESERENISADNKYASSEVKNAYMQSRFGNKMGESSAPSLILKEAFIKEYLSKDNFSRIKKLAEPTGAMEGKEEGDVMMRHTFSTSNGVLKDEYVSLSEYPFADLRFEPGPIYQTPLMERFIPANKSLDVAMSRIEAYFNTMVVGIWQKRKGENMSITNIPGGQVINYQNQPLTQMQPSSIPGYAFAFINKLDEQISEQGAATAALGQLPDGVKSGKAIESVKATEYANLKIPTDQLKFSVRNITKRMLDVAANFFVEPQNVQLISDGEPDYFDIIGQAGVAARQKAGLPTPRDVIVLQADDTVDIEIESGLGYTVQGKKDSMLQIVEYMGKLAEQGLIGPEAVKVVTTKFLEIFQFGATQEFTEAMELGLEGPPLDDEQIEQMKIAVAEVLKDAGIKGSNEQEEILKTKIGVVEAAKDLASPGNAAQGGAPNATR